jgi:predicted RNA polymerase sigma factor
MPRVLTLAKKTLSAAQVRFEVPPPDERRERLSSVLSLIYVIFNEGSTVTSGRI